MAIQENYESHVILSTDVDTTVHTKSGLAFTPKVLFGEAVAINGDGNNAATIQRVNFVVTAGAQACIGFSDLDNRASNTRSGGYIGTDCAIAELSAGGGVFSGKVSVAITADGYTLTVDNQLVASIEVSVHAVGGSSIIAAAAGARLKPATPGPFATAVAGMGGQIPNFLMVYHGGSRLVTLNAYQTQANPTWGKGVGTLAMQGNVITSHPFSFTPVETWGMTRTDRIATFLNVGAVESTLELTGFAADEFTLDCQGDDPNRASGFAYLAMRVDVAEVGFGFARTTTGPIVISPSSALTSVGVMARPAAGRAYTIPYDTEATGPFVLGETVTFGNGATGVVIGLIDSGTTGILGIQLTGAVPPDNDSITGGTSGATALVNGVAYPGEVVPRNTVDSSSIATGTALSSGAKAGRWTQSQGGLDLTTVTTETYNAKDSTTLLTVRERTALNTTALSGEIDVTSFGTPDITLDQTTAAASPFLFLWWGFGAAGPVDLYTLEEDEMIYRPYGVATTVSVELLKVGTRELATSADYTPVVADILISKDGGAYTAIGSVPVAVGPTWPIPLALAEMEAREIRIAIRDVAAKAVEDKVITIRTVPAGAVNAGKLVAGTTTTAELDASVTFADNVLQGHILLAHGGPGGHQAVAIISNVGNVVTFDRTLPVAFAAGTLYTHYPAPAAATATGGLPKVVVAQAENGAQTYKRGATVPFVFYLEASGGGPFTAGSVSVILSHDGAAFDPAVAATATANGFWTASLPMTGAEIAFVASAAGAKTSNLKIRTHL